MAAGFSASLNRFGPVPAPKAMRVAHHETAGEVLNSTKPR
jgi:hypothetical protein